MIAEILDRAGTTIQKHGWKKDEIRVCCPFCVERGESEDTRFRLGINVVRGVGHCYNCDWRSNSVLITCRELCRIYGLSFDLSTIHGLRIEEEFINDPEPDPSGLVDGYEPFTFDGTDEIEQRAVAYLTGQPCGHPAGRRVTKLQIRRHHIGFAGAGPMSGRIIFPVYGDDGLVYGCVGRDFSREQKPKYLNTPGLKLLWNAHRDSKAAVVCEGIMDALAVERAVVNSNFVATARLGSTITQHQLKQLSKYKYVIGLPDWDEAGIKGVMSLGKACAEAGIRFRVAIPERLTDLDPADMKQQEIVDALKNSVEWSQHAEWRLRAVQRP